MYANIKLIDPITGKKKINWTRTLFILSAIVLPLINWLVFYIFVNANSFLMAFQKEVNGKIIFTFANFELFFNEFSKSTSLIREAFRNTSISFLISTMMMGCGFLVSFFLYKKILFHKFYRIVFYMPGLIAGTVVSSFFSQFVGVDGPVVKLMMTFNEYEYIPDLLHNPQFANKTIFINMIVFSFATNMIIWSGAFSRIPDSVIEAGKLDGVNWIQEIYYLTIPMVWPTFALQVILSVCGFFGASGNVFLLTRGDYGTMTLNCWMYLQTLDKNNDINALNYLSAIGLLLTIVSISISITVRKFTNKAFADVQF